MVIVSDVYDSNWAMSNDEPSLNSLLNDEKNTGSNSEVLNAAKNDKLSDQFKEPLSCERKLNGLKTKNLNGKDESACDQNLLTDEWIDVLGGGYIMRKILRLGDGNCPKVGDWITINSTCLTSTADTFTNYRFVLGFHLVVETWDIIFQLMQKGEKCHVKCHAQFAYGELGLDNLVEKDQPQEYLIELVDIGENFSIYSETADLEDSEVVAFLYRIKERANFFYRRQDIEKSLFLYEKGIELFSTHNVDNVLLLKKLIAQFYSNISACHYKLKDWKTVVEFAKKSLQFDETSCKVLCRQAKALCYKHCYMEALKCLNRAINIDPSNEMVKRQILLVKRQEEDQKMMEKQVYQRMLNGLADKKFDAAKMLPKKYLWRRWIQIAKIANSVAILAFIIYFVLKHFFF